MVRFFLTMFIVFCPLCGKAIADDKMRVLLDWFVNPDHGPLIIAEENGYFADVGLEVEVVAPADPSAPPKLVAAGQADIFASLRPKNEWDICAGNCIINEAGGKLIDLNGNRVVFNREKTLIEPGLIAGNIDAVDKTFEVLKA